MKVDCRWCGRSTPFVMTKVCPTCSELMELLGKTRPNVLARILQQYHLGGAYLQELLAALQQKAATPVPDATDSKRVDWLEDDSGRLEDVRGRINNEGGSIREAIDWFSLQQEVTQS